jgi:hypothetical protein
MFASVFEVLTLGYFEKLLFAALSLIIEKTKMLEQGIELFGGCRYDKLCQVVTKFVIPAPGEICKF